MPTCFRGPFFWNTVYFPPWLVLLVISDAAEFHTWGWIKRRLAVEGGWHCHFGVCSAVHVCFVCWELSGWYSAVFSSILSNEIMAKNNNTYLYSWACFLPPSAVLTLFIWFIFCDHYNLGFALERCLPLAAPGSWRIRPFYFISWLVGTKGPFSVSIIMFSFAWIVHVI